MQAAGEQPANRTERLAAKPETPMAVVGAEQVSPGVRLRPKRRRHEYPTTKLSAAPMAEAGAAWVNQAAVLARTLARRRAETPTMAAGDPLATVDGMLQHRRAAVRTMAAGARLVTPDGAVPAIHRCGARRMEGRVVRTTPAARLRRLQAEAPIAAVAGGDLVRSTPADPAIQAHRLHRFPSDPATAVRGAPKTGRRARNRRIGEIVAEAAAGATCK